MPDVLHWLGIRKIHRLVSMSNMKYDAITGSGIEVGERVNDPRRADPGRRAGGDGRQDGGRLLHPGRGARRRRAGEGQGPRVWTDEPRAHRRADADTAGRAAQPRRCAPRPPCASARGAAARSARARATRAASPSTTTRCRRPRPTVADVTRARYPDLEIPLPQPLAALRGRRRRPHGRARRAAGGAATRRRGPARMIDLAVVSVLLDAGAGPAWRYREAGSGQRVHPLRGPGGRELRMPSWPGCSPATRRDPLQVDAPALRALDDDRLAEAFQVGADNPLVGPRRPRARCCAGSARRWPRSPRCSARTAGPAACSTLLRRGRAGDGRPRTTILLAACSTSLSAESGLADNAHRRRQPLGDCWRHPAVARRRA